MKLAPQSKQHRLSDPIATCGDRLYAICSQHGLFPDAPGGHIPGEMWGVWDHPIKLLDGFWFGLSEAADASPRWLDQARECRAYPTHNEFDYDVGALRIVRRDFVPDGVEGMVVSLEVQSRAPQQVTLHALFRSDLRPAWLGEEAGMVDGRDAAIICAWPDPGAARPPSTPTAPPTPPDANTVCLFTDAANPWACVVGADRAPADVLTGEALWAVERTAGQGTSAWFKFAIATAPPPDGEHAHRAVIHFFIAGSSASPDDAWATYRRLMSRHAALVEAKRAQAEAILATGRLVTPDARLNEAAAWSKLINQMFVREVPRFGRGVGAGFPEYPWWFGIDTAYAALPMLQSGQFEPVRDTLRLLKTQSALHNPNEPGRVIHEMSTTGVVFNRGNMVEVPTFVRAVHQYWLWTGDNDFLAEMYPFCTSGLLDYALGTHDADGDLCPAGASIIETVEMHAGFEVIDVAAYTWDALVRLADMAAVIGDAAAARRLEARAAALGRRIREEWWRPDEGLFADVRASVDEVTRVLGHLERTAREQDWLLVHQRDIEGARARFGPDLARYAGHPRDVDLPWLLRHWVVMCPIEVGIATPEQAQRSLARLQSAEFCNEWGMYLHPERHDVMSINTGLLALAAARYGYADDALAILHKLVRAFSYRTPGAVCEALPDQWCFLQLWSNVGLVSPVIEHFLGIAPRAAEHTITIAPNLPTAWDWAEVGRLRVGDAHFDIRVERDGAGYRVDVQGGEGWTIEVEPRAQTG